MLALPGIRWEVGCGWDGWDGVEPGMEGAGGGGGGDRSLKCPPPVEVSSGVEEAQTEKKELSSQWDLLCPDITDTWVLLLVPV